MLLLGQVLPPLVFLYAWVQHQSEGLRVAASVALIASYAPRLIAAVRFKQPLFAALCHPGAIFLLLGIQWYALARAVFRIPAIWKGRRYSTT